jgi:hypothetical protein
MKKIIMILVSFTILLGCETEPEPPELLLPTIQDQLQDRFDELGIKPSDIESISYFGGIVDSTSYKFALGRKNDHAWLAKFDPNGNELFSYQCKDLYDNFEYSHCNSNSFMAINDNFIALLIWFSNNTDPSSFEYYDAGSALYVIDFNSGKELHKFSFSKNDKYDIIKTPYSYFLQSTRTPALPGGDGRISNYQSISLDGKKFWERKLIDNEKQGITNYNNCVFWDDENIFYFDGTYKSMNIKDYKLNYEVDIPVNNNYSPFGSNKLNTKLNDISVIDNYIFVNYGVYKSLNNYDYELLGECYYKIDKNTGNIIEDKSINGDLYGISIKGLYMYNPLEQQYPLDYYDLKLCHGDKLKIKIKFFPQNVDNQNLIWSSSNTNLATVKDGMFTITSDTNAKGIVIITATSENGGHTANLEISVDDVYLNANGLRLIQSQNSCDASFISSITTSPVSCTPITIGSVYITDSNNSLIQIVSDIQNAGYKVIARSQPVTVYGWSLNYFSTWKFVYTYKLPWMSDFTTKEIAINANVWGTII